MKLTSESKKPFKIGELVYCECPPGAVKLPVGLPSGAVVEVAATKIDTTHVLYLGRLFAVPTACVHSK